MKKKENYSFRNNNKNIFAILGDNKKYLMPVVFALAVVLTVVIALSANKRSQEQAITGGEADIASSVEIPELKMEENAYPEVNALIQEYYNASANGDSEVITSIYKGLEETELLKAVAAADYIEEFQNIKVYTKPGPVAGSFVAYVYNEVKLYNYPKAVPGLESMYICTDEDGKLYINGDVANANEIEYLRQVNVQADVIDLNNEVATAYNDMVNSDEELAELLTKMRAGLQVSVGESLASSEATSAAAEESSADEAATAATSEAGTQTVTTHTIRATDVVNIRSSDSETADIISKTAKGDEYKQLEALANGWSKIEYNGGVAYVKTEFFEVVGEETVEVENETQTETENTEETSTTTGAENNNGVKPTDTGKMTVSDTVRLRESQSTDSEVLVMIYSGSTVNVIEQYANGWAKVEYDKKTGYIKSEFLSK
ncbi:SH3 domain-containing protein [Butyrivibrio sp. INlla14]|uniref:SH3 domain-containing protein n=1 Tax=Butyrivibrio sp. INlla14 TaxID=1520808 RepID=UPI000877456F|nr:SH3 domain-containing protein [Butyrivibrio sp. INlla14]SCY46681.1 SH3 domain-containing protein [Butyrivibrio sp. INlla14]